MGTSVENGGGEEEEFIPWSCVDELIRQELVSRLNPECIVSGSNWRGLGGRLGYTTRQLNDIEALKRNNTMEFFNNYDINENASYNEVYRCLKDMERQDCLQVLDKFKRKIKQNFEIEKEKEARLLQQINSSIRQPSHISQHMSCQGGCSCTNHQFNLSHHHPSGAAPFPHQHTCSHTPCNMPSHPHNHDAFNHCSYPSSPCYHPMQTGPPMQVSNGCMSMCSNQSPTTHCSHLWSQQQQSCNIPPHLRMNVSPPAVPTCSGYHFQASPTPPIYHPSMTNPVAFSDRPQGYGASPNPHFYSNEKNGSFSPKVSPDNNKPFNFSVPGSYPSGAMADGTRVLSRENVRSRSRSNVIERPNILVSKSNSGQIQPLPDNISPQFNSVGSNDNNTSYPVSPYFDSMPRPPPHGQQQHYPTRGSNDAGATGSPMEVGVIDSKKSLEKLMEISKVPNQPTDAYKSFVAEQKVENKKQRSRNSRGSGTGSIISSSSGNSSASTASSSSSHSGHLGPKVQASNNQEELPPMAALSIGKSPSAQSELRQEETDGKGINSKTFITYSRDSEDDKLEVLKLSLFLSDNDFCVYADVATDPVANAAGGTTEPYEELYALADFILVCISPKYLEDIAQPNPLSLPPVPTRGSSGRPIHTHQIYQMMKKEHHQQLQSATRRRQPCFVCLLFGNTKEEQIPLWLRKNYPTYRWPAEYENICWFLKKPLERICAQPGRKRYL